MEEYVTKNKLYNSILQPITAHLQQSNFEAFSKSVSTLDCTVENVWKFATNGIESVDNDVADEVHKFFDASKAIQAVDKPSPLQWREFIIVLHATLSTIDDYKVRLIERSLDKCQTHLESLEPSLIPEYLKSWFKEFCQNICRSVALMQRRAAESESNITRNQICLHMVQLTTSLRLAFNMFRQELAHKVLFTESRRFLTKRYVYCFDGLRRYLTEDKCSEPAAGFIQWMDTALDMLATIDSVANDAAHLAATKSAIEEVLCHAMSMAQISGEEDRKRLRAGVQAVLHELSQLEAECNKHEQNPSLCNLYMDIVSDKLCSLERKVNTAVLHIALNVFARPTAPLDRLQHLCEETDASIMERVDGDLDDLVAEFDAHVDGVVQVGLFAVACSRNRSVVARVRSCLASFEALESELVPALTALYLEPATLACLQATLLADHWRDEAQKLKGAVCFIIDPAACGQVVYEDYKVRLEALADYMARPTALFTRPMLTAVYERLQLYVLVAEASIADMKLANTSDIVHQYNRLMDIFIEVGAAITQLCDEPAYSRRILKRMHILRTMLKRSIKSFSTGSHPQGSPPSQRKAPDSKRAQVQTILYEESIRQLQDRGGRILKERSVLYRPAQPAAKLLPVATPNERTVHKCLESKKARLSVVRRVQKVSGCPVPGPNNTLDLQITQILESVSALTLADD